MNRFPAKGLNPEQTLGILGGGQLGRFLCISAQKRGWDSLVWDPSPEACAAEEASCHLKAPYDDAEALAFFGTHSKIITYEFENIPFTTIYALLALGASVPQGAKPLFISQNRVREKEVFRSLSIPVADYRTGEDRSRLHAACQELGCPAFLKTAQGGYDGKGQQLITCPEDIPLDLPLGEYILEKKIPFDQEISLMGVRSLSGEIVFFPPSENYHREGILRRTFAPAPLTEECTLRLQKAVRALLEGLDLVGPLAVEFFVQGDNIYANEMAPRPHNSFHWTLDGCSLSQFDVHLASLLGEPLQTPQLIQPVFMVNILGEHKKLLPSQGKRYLYGKKDWEPRRKMGHLNFTGAEALAMYEDASCLKEFL